MRCSPDVSDAARLLLHRQAYQEYDVFRRSVAELDRRKARRPEGWEIGTRGMARPADARKSEDRGSVDERLDLMFHPRLGFQTLNPAHHRAPRCDEDRHRNGVLQTKRFSHFVAAVPD